MGYDLQFVDSIAATPTVRLNLNAAPWTTREGTDFGMPELRRAAVMTLLVDGDRYPAAAYGNRMLTLVLRVDTTSDDGDATQLQRLYRELDRPTNILLYRPGTSAPVFFPTFRCGPDSVVWDPFTKEVTVQVPAGPFPLGPKETLSAATVYNDPAESTATLNANPYFETNAASWTTVGATSFVRSTAQFHQGVASGLLTPTGVAATTELYSESVPVTAGSSYRVSAWVRCAAARSIQIYTVWFDSGGGFLSSSSTTTAVAATTWTLLDYAATAPVGATMGRLGVVMPSTPPASATLHVDEARIRPAGGVGGMCLDVASPKGDVETPLFLQFAASSVPAPDLPPDEIGPTWQPMVAVRRRGTPSAMPLVFQAESWSTRGTDATVPGNDPTMSGSGSNYVRQSFASFTGPTSFLQHLAPWPPTPSVDSRGTYRVFARVRKSSAASVMTMRLIYQANNQTVALRNDLVTLRATAGLQYVDLGLLSIPIGIDPVTDGYTGVEMATRGVWLTLQAERASGTGTLDVDFLLLMPADDRFAVMTWQDMAPSGATSYILDSGRDMAYAVGSSGEMLPGVVQLAGQPPMVSPGVANRIVMVNHTGQISAADALTQTTTVTPYYWPRYMHVRPVST